MYSIIICCYLKNNIMSSIIWILFCQITWRFLNNHFFRTSRKGNYHIFVWFRASSWASMLGALLIILSWIRLSFMLGIWCSRYHKLRDILYFLQLILRGKDWLLTKDLLTMTYLLIVSQKSTAGILALMLNLCWRIPCSTLHTTKAYI